MITIRPYAPDDFDRTVALLRQLQQHLANGDPSIACSSDYGPEEMRGYLKDADEANGATFVAEEDGAMVGFVQGVIWKHDDAAYMRAHAQAAIDGWVGLLVVDPEHRSQGTGKALLERMEQYFSENGCRRCRIKVSAYNELARTFYANRGYKEWDVEVGKHLA